MSFVRQYQDQYRSPMKSTNASPAVTPNSTLQKKQHPYPNDTSPNFVRQSDRSVSPQPFLQSRRESITDKMTDMVKLNEKLRDEAEYWHRKSLEKDKVVNDVELKRLIQMCEKQALELRETKYRADQGEQKILQLQQNYNIQSNDSDQSYQTDLDLQSLGQELSAQMRNIDEMQVKMNNQNNLISKMKFNEDLLKKDNQKQQEEITQLRKALSQQQKERQHTSRGQMNSHQFDAIQQSHIVQIKVLNEQITQLQTELVKKSEEYENLSSDNEALLNEQRQYQEQEDQLLKQIYDLQNQFNFIQEDKQKELNFLGHQKDQQITQLSKSNNDQRVLSSNKIQQLEQMLRDVSGENQKYKNDIISIQQQLQGTSTQGKDYEDAIEQLQQQHDNDVKLIKEVNQNTIDSIKSTYQRQLDLLVDQVDKLRHLFKDVTQECEQNKQAVEQLTGYLENAEVNENELLRELESWKNKYEELEQHCQSEIQRMDESNQQYIQELQASNDQQVLQLEQQLNSCQQIIDLRMKEVNDMRFQKNDLAKKLNDHNTTIQILQGEVEQLKSKFFEQQRQQDIQEQIREEIRKSQNDQQRRQYEVKTDQMENENRNLNFLLEGKSRECEEWKTTYLRGRSIQN